MGAFATQCYEHIIYRLELNLTYFLSEGLSKQIIDKDSNEIGCIP